MSPTLIATICGVIVALCWGTSDYLSAKLSKRLKPLQINFGIDLVGLPLMAVLFVIFGAHLDTWEQFLRIAANTACIAVAYTLMVKALSSGVVGIVVPLSNSYPVFTIILSLAFATASFSGAQFAAMAGIVIGAAALAYEKNHKKIPLHELHRESIIALIAAVIWGAGFFIVDPVLQEVSWQTVAIVGQCLGSLIGAVMLVAVHRRDSFRLTKQVLRTRLMWVTGGVGIVGAMAFYFGGEHGGSLLIPTVLSSAGPLVASFWGAVFDQEKLGALKRAGAVLIVAGIVVLNIA
jgi:drug/metabolite transporter (DMT)-like permease